MYFEINVFFRSLGCIVYELVVGAPPFQTNSILHLVKLIKFEAINWPDFISSTCKSFLEVKIFVYMFIYFYNRILLYNY